jgi:hypothetical protein
MGLVWSQALLNGSTARQCLWSRRYAAHLSTPSRQLMLPGSLRAQWSPPAANLVSSPIITDYARSGGGTALPVVSFSRGCMCCAAAPGDGTSTPLRCRTESTVLCQFRSLVASRIQQSAIAAMRIQFPGPLERYTSSISRHLTPDIPYDPDQAI